jgi:enoyl-CoA hydratase/carnithine racemase
VGEYVGLEVSEGIATIRLDRPPMNALSLQVQREFAEAAGAADADVAVRAIIVYGGPKVFAAGADVKEMADWDEATARASGADLHRCFDAVAAVSKPTIAAITGYALGGGLELALCCDLRVAGDNVKVGLPEILLGIIPGAGGTQRLTRLVGPARAKDLILTGRFADAGEAADLGIIDRVVAPDEVYTAARALAQRLAGGAGLAQQAAKRAIEAAVDRPLAEGLAVERAEFAGLFATEDQTIGMRSFLQSGPGKAEFVGR